MFIAYSNCYQQSKNILFPFEYDIPFMFQSVVAAEPFRSVNSHETPDEVLSTVRDIIPVRTVELVLASHDLREERRVVLVVERGITA